MTRTADEKRLVLGTHIEQGRMARLLLQDDGVDKFLADLVAHWTDQMIKCEPLDDDGRRGHALQIAALQSLMRHFHNTVKMGERAQTDLQNLKG